MCGYYISPTDVSSRLFIGSVILTKYQRMTDRRTDGRTDRYLLYQQHSRFSCAPTVDVKPAF